MKSSRRTDMSLSNSSRSSDSNDDDSDLQDGNNSNNGEGKEGEGEGEDGNKRHHQDSNNGGEWEENELPDFSTLESCSRNDITDFVTKMSAIEGCDVESVKSTGKDLMMWIHMSKTPKGSKQLNFFYLFRTSHKSEIASQYSNDDDEEMSENNDAWITHLVSFLKYIGKFNWDNSFEHRPENGIDKEVSFYFGR